MRRSPGSSKLSSWDVPPTPASNFDHPAGTHNSPTQGVGSLAAATASSGALPAVGWQVGPPPATASLPLPAAAAPSLAPAFTPLRPPQRLKSDIPMEDADAAVAEAPDVAGLTVALHPNHLSRPPQPHLPPPVAPPPVAPPAGRLLQKIRSEKSDVPMVDLEGAELALMDSDDLAGKPRRALGWSMSGRVWAPAGGLCPALCRSFPL